MEEEYFSREDLTRFLKISPSGKSVPSKSLTIKLLRGCQHCKEKHLHRYLTEFDFRYSDLSVLSVSDGNVRCLP